MSKTIIVSNRLPLSLTINSDEVTAKPSVGGLATGLKSVHRDGNGLWIGWSGLINSEITGPLVPKIEKALEKQKCASVLLSKNEVDNFYFGFSNRTLWPLFHYFTEYTEFIQEQWEIYVQVNQKFADLVVEKMEEDDQVWIHDYQLLLVPGMIRAKKPNVKIGFFLHIPFPSYEVFRIIPWREELLKGILGSDLIGVHTYDYERHFISSVQRILGCDVNFNHLLYETRHIKVESFPMGIDFQKFNSAAFQHSKSNKKSEIRKSIDKHFKIKGKSTFILSIDRLDYTKGIAKRLLAFEYFLEMYPEYLGKVRLVMLAVPSRTNVPQYQDLKNEIDQLVGRINGKYADINWNPIWYFYRSMPFENLIDLYCSCDIALLTPVRDGMNLVAKEYIACRTDNSGVLILSEMAGAANELNEALIINPNNFRQVADAIKEAINMPVEEQKRRNKTMQARIAKYNVERWAEEFLQQLRDTISLTPKNKAIKLAEKNINELVNAIPKNKKTVLFLDYDGTLREFQKKPEEAKPTKEIYQLLDQLSQNFQVTLISGRDKKTFNAWFGKKDYTLICEHGLWQKSTGQDWKLLEKVNNSWFEVIFPIMDRFIERTPGSSIEIKNYSMAWHYRGVDPVLGNAKAIELKTTIQPLIANHNIEIMEGDKVLEVKVSGVTKGRAAAKYLMESQAKTIVAMGDDWTDEYLFQDLPEESITIKVGNKETVAKYRLRNVASVHDFLRKLL